ncbi:MAG: carboxylating nicotinate-nucleotide diphosphorylase [Solirubrobacterales bacterium]|nr:carboxylating nicotinate-nucleotide diphosphorylase [Solirubrobacterales bacterium]MCB8971430.1 carboxylating nicotinate-nucleotide diphosphorylase [Thermoleophilales bacterium]MCO5327512.1 carboxylating nicotinate-nucleotide diphosphorylase [Solirubrobacterales bacterium]
MTARPGEGWRDLIARALEEDIGPGDVTGEATVPAEAHARAVIVQKQAGVIFGLGVAAEVFHQVGAGDLDRLVPEGEAAADVPREIAVIAGPARALLAGERVALNLLGRLSGIATLTARYVEAAASQGGMATVLDTRKTTPGLRELEKAAVRAGGGRNHRMGLYDAILIKENHIALAGGGLGEAVARARRAQPDLEVEVECRNLSEVEDALACAADRLLLDNMDLDGLRACVAARDADEGRTGRRPHLEASGGVNLDTIGAISATGVEFVSVGALTHSATTLDLSLLLEPA